MNQSLAAGCLLVLAALLASALHSGRSIPEAMPSGAAGADSLIVVGVGGLVPGDLDPSRTPALWALLRDGSSAALNVTSVHATTCPVDGWLTLSAGGRAGQPDAARSGAGPSTPGDSCGALPTVAGASIQGWAAIEKAAADRPYDAMPGTLAAILNAQGQCISAVGPGAALAAAMPHTGAVAHYQAFDGTTLTTGLATCRTTLVDVGSIGSTGSTALAASAGSTGSSRALQVGAIDARVGQVVAAAPSGADVLVAGLSDDGGSAGLRLVAVAGPRFGPGALYSPSTRQSGLVQLEDVTATIVRHVGVTVPDAIGGSTLRRVPAATNSVALAEQRQADLVDVDLSSRAVQPVVEPFFVGWGLVMVLALAGLGLMWWRGLGSGEQRRSARTWVRDGLVVASAVPAATFLANLAPWWRFVWPPVALVALVLVWAGVMGAVALRGPWRRATLGPPAAIAVMTFLVLAVDIVTGSRLQVSSLLGLNPIVGGRFYGFGNVSFALFAAATFLAAIAVAGRLRASGRPRAAAMMVALIGLLAVAIDAAPIWGADAGGPPALIPGIALLVLAVLGAAVTWRRAVLLVGATVGAVLVIALADWLRPASSRSHLGRFVQTVLDGSGRGIITRKLIQNFDTLTQTTVFAYLVPVVLVLTVWVCLRPDSRLARPLRPLFTDVDCLRQGLAALTVTLVVGLFLNDTGVAIPAVAWALAFPLVISAALRVGELRSREGRTLTRAERRHS